MAAGDALNLKQVAARLGVHYSTVYRYVRTHRLSATRAAIGWEVSEAQLAAFLNSQTSPESGVGVDWRARLRVPLAAGDETASWLIIESALAAGCTPQECYLELLAGSLADIAGDPDCDSFLASAVASRIVARLGARFRRPGRSRGTVVLGAPAGEMHTLPIAIVADLVRLAGFTCLELGADIPPEAFARSATAADRLVAVGLGISQAARLDAVRDTVTQVRLARPGTPIVLGGQGVLNADVAAITGADAWAADGAEAVELIERLAVTPKRAKQRSAPRPNPLDRAEHGVQ